jgi:hypothetical protein
MLNGCVLTAKKLCMQFTFFLNPSIVLLQFIAGIVLMAAGMDALWNESIVSVAVKRFNLSGTVSTVQSLLLTGMIVIIAFDALVMLVLFFIRPKQFKIWRLT